MFSNSPRTGQGFFDQKGGGVHPLDISSRRKTLGILAAGTILALTASPALAGLGRASRWTQAGGDSGRSNSNAGERILDASNVSALEIEWVRDSGRAMPVFSNGRGYAGTEIFDPADGSGIAPLDAPAVDDSSPALLGGRVVATSWDDPSLSAMDADTGNLLWSKPFGDAGSSPAVARNTIFSSANGVLRAVDPASGSVDWKRRVSTGDTSDPVVSGGLVIVRAPLDKDGSSSAQRVIALDAAEGDILWKRKTAYATTGYRDSVVAADGMVLTAKGSALAALDLEDGSTLWETDVSCCDHAPAIASGVVYTTQWTSEGGTLHAIDARTGAIIWTTTGTDFSDGVSVANGVVYLAAMGLQAFDASSGEKLLDLDIGVPWHAPVVVDGTVYLAIENGPESPPATGEGLYAFRLPRP